MTILKGKWKGEITEGTAQYPVYITFSESNGQITALIAKKYQEAPVIHAKVSLCAPNKFHFYGSTVSGEEFSYNARMKHNQLEGDIAIGRNCSKENRSRFTLTKL